MHIVETTTSQAARAVQRVKNELSESLVELVSGKADIDVVSAHTTAVCLHLYQRMFALGSRLTEDKMTGVEESIDVGLTLWRRSLGSLVEGFITPHDVIESQMQDFEDVFEVITGRLLFEVEEVPEQAPESQTKISLEEKARLRVKSYEKDKLGRYKNVLNHEFVGDNRRHAASLAQAHMKSDKFLAATGLEGKGKLTWDGGTVKLYAKKDWVGEDQGVKFADTESTTGSDELRAEQDSRPIYPPIT